MSGLDEKMMALALAEARKGWGRTSPNPMVGAVVVSGGRVIAKGWHHRAGAPHAEVEALSRAGKLAQGADMYVTLEPCHHHGRTPPCTEAVLKAGIKRVVIGTRDPNPKVKGGGADFLSGQGLKVEVGVLEERCRTLNEFFNKHTVTGRPFVILKSAATLDGKLATASGHSRWVTGPRARAHVHLLRDGVDAILVGRGTVAADDPTLNTRLPGRRQGRDPLRVVLDSKLSLPVNCRVFDRDLGGPTLVACGAKAPSKRIKALTDRGVEVWPLDLQKGRIDLDDLMTRLGRLDVQSVLIEGGAEINASALLEDRIVDRLLFFFAPKIVGGAAAPTLAGGAGVKTMDDCLRLENLRVRKMGQDLLVEARPAYRTEVPAGIADRKQKV